MTKAERLNYRKPRPDYKENHNQKPNYRNEEPNHQTKTKVQEPISRPQGCVGFILRAVQGFYLAGEIKALHSLLAGWPREIRILHSLLASQSAE